MENWLKDIVDFIKKYKDSHISIKTSLEEIIKYYNEEIENEFFIKELLFSNLDQTSINKKINLINFE